MNTKGAHGLPGGLDEYADVGNVSLPAQIKRPADDAREPPDEVVDWDAPFSAQTPEVQAALSALGLDFQGERVGAAIARHLGMTEEEARAQLEATEDAMPEGFTSAEGALAYDELDAPMGGALDY